MRRTRSSLETLIHDFDALRFLNPGATAVEVFATATALVEPEWKDRGLLDTAVVVVRFDNGAVGTAEACFEAAYGYDVRGEVFGSGGMATMGGGRRTGMVFSGAAGELAETVRSDQELLSGAYTAELAAFVDAVRAGGSADVDRRGRPRLVGDRAGRRRIGGIGPPGADRGAGEVSFRLAVSAEMVFTGTAVRSSGSAVSTSWDSRWRSGTGRRRTSPRWSTPAPRSPR